MSAGTRVTPHTWPNQVQAPHVTAPRTRLQDTARAGAFLRRDFLMAWSYRAAFISDSFSIITQALMFVFISRLVDPAAAASFGGSQDGYLAHVTVGIAVSAFLGVGMSRMHRAIGSERFMGTLEPILMTPTSMITVQLGWLSYDLLYVPVRTAVFVIVMAVAFDLALLPGGAIGALGHVVAFLPFVWGVSSISAGSALIFRRAVAVGSLGGFALTFTSGAWFPLDLFPRWVAVAAQYNPLAIAIEGSRAALIDGAGLTDLLPGLGLLCLWSGVTLAVGLRVFSRSLRRELRNGSIGLY